MNKLGFFTIEDFISLGERKGLNPVEFLEYCLENDKYNYYDIHQISIDLCESSKKDIPTLVKIANLVFDNHPKYFMAIMANEFLAKIYNLNFKNRILNTEVREYLDDYPRYIKLLMLDFYSSTNLLRKLDMERDIDVDDDDDIFDIEDAKSIYDSILEFLDAKATFLTGSEKWNVPDHLQEMNEIINHKINVTPGLSFSASIDMDFNAMYHDRMETFRYCMENDIYSQVDFHCIFISYCMTYETQLLKLLNLVLEYPKYLPSLMANEFMSKINFDFPEYVYEIDAPEYIKDLITYFYKNSDSDFTEAVEIYNLMKDYIDYQYEFQEQTVDDYDNYLNILESYGIYQETVEHIKELDSN